MSRILPVQLLEFDATSLSGTAQDFGDPLEHPALKVNFFNTGNTDVYISADTTIPFLVRIPAGGALTLDESTLYFRGVDQEYYLPRGAQLQVEQVTGPSTDGGSIIGNIVTRQLQ